MKAPASLSTVVATAAVAFIVHGHDASAAGNCSHMGGYGQHQLFSTSAPWSAAIQQVGFSGLISNTRDANLAGTITTKSGRQLELNVSTQLALGIAAYRHGTGPSAGAAAAILDLNVTVRTSGTSTTRMLDTLALWIRV